MDQFSQIMKEFADKWLYDPKCIKGTDAELEAIENKLKIYLPQNYKSFINSYGPASTKWLLNSIVEGEYDLPDLQEFLPVNKIIELTNMYESGGMEPGYLTFASDGSGNMFLFRLTDCVSQNIDTPVFFFDHDFCEIDKLEDSFGNLLNQYMKVEYKEG